MQGHIASFSSPIKWLRQGLSAIRQAPFGMVSICIFYVFTMSVLGALPMFGLVVAAFFMPFGTMLIIEGTREAYEGRQPSYGVLVELFKDPFKRSRLMRVGVIYAAFLLVANYLYIFMAVDEVSQWQVVDGLVCARLGYLEKHGGWESYFLFLLRLLKKLARYRGVAHSHFRLHSALCLSSHFYH